MFAHEVKKDKLIHDRRFITVAIVALSVVATLL